MWQPEHEAVDCVASQLASLLKTVLPADAVKQELKAAFDAGGGRIAKLFKERVGFVLWRTVCAGRVSEGYLHRRGLGWLKEQLCGVCARIVKLVQHLEHVYLPIYSQLLEGHDEEPGLILPEVG